MIQKIDANPSTRLVIIDTLARIKPAQSGKDSQYQADYPAMTGLHRIANERGIGIVVVHHVRKAEASDPFDMISGSNGLAGAADTTLVLTTTADGKILYGRGRDIAEFEAAVSFDPQTCQWSDDGLPCEAYGNPTRQAIRLSLKEGKQTPKEISADADIDYDLCAKTLQRMAEGGEVEKGGHGRYRLTPDYLSI